MGILAVGNVVGAPVGADGASVGTADGASVGEHDKDGPAHSCRADVLSSTVEGVNNN